MIDAPYPLSLTAPACLICSAETTPHFTKDFHSTEITYYECPQCCHLTTRPFEETSIYGDHDYFLTTDSGWQRRNERIVHFLNLLRRLPGLGISHTTSILDFGCGTGKLVDDLIDVGYTAWGYDPYPNPLLQSSHVYTDWAQMANECTAPGLITCVEVLEHLRTPHEVMTRIQNYLAPGGYLLLSTGIYNQQVHTHDWYYLHPYAGHVSIFSACSIQMLAKQHGLHPVARINQDVWLFRKVDSRTMLEQVLFAITQLRIKLGIRLRY